MTGFIVAVKAIQCLAFLVLLIQMGLSGHYALYYYNRAQRRNGKPELSTSFLGARQSQQYLLRNPPIRELEPFVAGKIRNYRRWTVAFFANLLLLLFIPLL